MKAKWLALGMVFSGPTLAGMEVVALGEEERSELLEQISSSIREDPWNDEIAQLRAYRMEGESGDHYGVTINFEPYSQDASIKKSVTVHCAKFPQASEWDCFKEADRHVYSSALPIWVALLSEELEESEALNIVEVLGESEKLYKKDGSFELKVKDLERLSIALTPDGAQIDLHANHSVLGPIVISIARDAEGKELEILEVVQFFAICDDFAIQHGFGPCSNGE